MGAQAFEPRAEHGRKKVDVSAPRTRKRWLELLRRTAGVTETRPALDDAALWDACERASKSAHDAEKLGERVVAASVRQRTNVEATLERASNALSRRETLSTHVRHVHDSLERLGVLGLNAGLEGARSPEPTGRALTLVAEDIRAHVSRGADSSRDLRTHVDDLFDVVADLAGRVERVQREAQDLASDAAQMKSAVQVSITAIGDLDARLRKATGIDPETAKYIAQAGEHAKGLLGALAALETNEARQAVAALVPLLTPVMKVLSTIVNESSPSGPSSGSGG